MFGYLMELVNQKNREDKLVITSGDRADMILAAIAAVLYINGIISTAIPVEVATVSQLYPSQVLSQLNASGYVVAQRKAAVASKITGRLVALMVEEGSRVKGQRSIARLDRDHQHTAVGAELMMAHEAAGQRDVLSGHA
jgi:multidrug efflux pump subunit AcrA (membrane-fusion protein)